MSFTKMVNILREMNKGKIENKGYFILIKKIEKNLK